MARGTSKMPAFLISPLAKFAVYALLLIALLVTAFAEGMSYEQTLQAAAERDQAIATITIVKRQLENTARIETKYIRLKGETQIRTETVEKEVIRYVEAKHPDCFIPRQFEWVWDDANGLPASANPIERADAGADSCLSPAEILQAHADDARIIAQLKDLVAALREFIASSYVIQQAGAGR